MPRHDYVAAFLDFRHEASFHRLLPLDDLPTEDEIAAQQKGIEVDQRRRYAAAIRDRAAEAQDYS